MKTSHFQPIDQTSFYMQDLAKLNNTTVSTCGYITCALCEYFSEQFDFEGALSIKQINENNMTPYIERVMKRIKGNREKELEIYKDQMCLKDQKNYVRDWVASYEIADYLQSIVEKMINPNVFFFRQCGYDNPEALKTIKYEEAKRVVEEEPFKGERIFYNKFIHGDGVKFIKKEHFCEEIQKAAQNNANLPIIVATDVLGHFNVTILFQGEVLIVDSLGGKGMSYDQDIVEFLVESYRKSYLKK